MSEANYRQYSYRYVQYVHTYPHVIIRRLAKSPQHRLPLAQDKRAKIEEMDHAAGQPPRLAMRVAELLRDGVAAHQTAVRVHGHDDRLALGLDQPLDGDGHGEGVVRQRAGREVGVVDVGAGGESGVDDGVAGVQKTSQ